ncbi:MAG: MerR family transcriptional regulator [Clostridiaceae bacterium]
MKDNYSIGDVVKKLKVNKETIRYYEKIGLLNETKKDSNGYRLYTEDDIAKIRFILIVKNFGFSLKEIGVLLPKIYDEIACGNNEGVKKIVEEKIIEITDKIKELDKTKKLLEKVNDTVLSQRIDNCINLESYIEN